MSTTSTFKKGGSRSKQQARTRSRWILRLWNQRNNSDTCSSQAVSTTEYDADSVGLELSFPARSSPSSSLTAIDSQEQHHPHLSVVPSISSLAAPSGDETDTPDKDHVSASSCSHVARNISEIAEREVTTVASSSNPASYASAEAIEQDVSRQLVSHSDNSSRGYQISPSPRVGDDDSGVATSIPHIVVSEDISPRAAEASQPTTRVMRSSQTPLCLPTPEATTSEAVAQVAESSESISLPRRSAVNHTYDWSTDQREFEECIPSHIGHYNRKTHIDEMTVAEFTVPAMQTDFNTYRPILPQTEGEEVLTAGWTKHTHSDGKPYFYHDHDKIITEEWLYDRAIAERISRYISILNDAISKRSESFGRVKSWHLYVEITEPARENDNCTRCRYYFVNHDAECIFWLSQCPLDGYLWELRGDISPDLIRRFLQREYWNHHYFFSELHLLTKAQWNSVQKTILLAEADVTMSDTSTVAWSIEKLKNMSESIIKAEKLDVSEVAASCMASLLHDQILNYVGQRDVRTNRDESVYGNDYSGREPTVPFRIMNLLLFYAPIKHYIFLNKIWVDRIISRGQWQYLIEQTTNKWQQHVGLATILLAVNMGFLAIPSVDKMVETQTLCYLSVASSMGTIVIGLLLVNHHNSMKDVNVGVVASFLERHWQLDLGFERLSIMYSIPYALLMWGMVSFLVSFFSMCLESSNPISMKVFMTLVFILGIALCLWCIYLLWDGSNQWLQQCFEFQQGPLFDLRETLRSILSYENLLRLRDKIRQAAMQTTESLLPTTTDGV